MYEIVFFFFLFCINFLTKKKKKIVVPFGWTHEGSTFCAPFILNFPSTLLKSTIASNDKILPKSTRASYPQKYIRFELYRISRDALFAKEVLMFYWRLIFIGKEVLMFYWGLFKKKKKVLLRVFFPLWARRKLRLYWIYWIKIVQHSPHLAKMPSSDLLGSPKFVQASPWCIDIKRLLARWFFRLNQLV